jgi:hypothetical protein
MHTYIQYVNEFSPETSNKIFGSPVNRQVLFFADKESAKFKDEREH